MESKTTQNIKKEETNDVVSLKKKGDEFFEQGKFDEAYKCYNSAIKQDGSNPELLMCRAETYYRRKEYYGCMSDTKKIIALCTNKERLDSLKVFRALKLLAETKIADIFSYMPDDRPQIIAKSRSAFERAMQINVPVAEIEALIISYNNLINDCSNPGSEADFEAGIMQYSYGGRQKAIELFTKASKDPLAYPLRAVCYAEDANREQELLADVKKCIELDYRNLVYLAKKVEEFRQSGQTSASFRLLKALSLSMETYKLSVGKFFPKLLDGKPLNKLEIKRFKDLDESWRKIYLPTLERLVEKTDSDLQSDSELDSNKIKAADTNSVAKENEYISCLKKKGDELRGEKKYDEALEYYNKAIELDESDINLLICRVQLYYDVKKYSECSAEADKLVALYNRQERRYDCLPVFRALRLKGVSNHYRGLKTSAIEAFKQSLLIDAPAARIEQSIYNLNNLTKGCKNTSASSDALDAGIMHYSRSDRREAIKEFTNAIENNKFDPLAYACRAICYVDEPEDGQEYISDVKECIELDYRFINYFLDVNMANEMIFLGRISHVFRLYKAVSLSEAEFKLSAGRIFPKFLDAELLSDYDRRRFKDLDEWWRKNYLPILKRLSKL